MKTLEQKTAAARPVVERLIKITSSLYGLPAADFYGRDRREPLNTARQLVMAFAMDQGHKAEQVARVLNRHNRVAYDARRARDDLMTTPSCDPKTLSDQARCHAIASVFKAQP